MGFEFLQLAHPSMNLISLTFNTDPKVSSLTVCHLKIKYFLLLTFKSIIISQDLAERITESERHCILRELPNILNKIDFLCAEKKRSTKGKEKMPPKKPQPRDKPFL